MSKSVFRNAEGYYDPTAGAVLAKCAREDRKARSDRKKAARRARARARKKAAWNSWSISDDLELVQHKEEGSDGVV